MHIIYNQWPQIAKNAYESNTKKLIRKDIKHVVFAGMGGSGSICDLFNSIFSQSKIHVDVVKGYHLPSSTTKNSIVIPISVSGNTVETISVLKEAIPVGCKIIAFSSGGKMEKICQKNHIDFHNIDMIHSPRASFVKYVYSMLKILESIIPIKRSDVYNSISKLNELSLQINSDQISSQNPSLKLAHWITSIPLIYYPWGLHTAAIRFKNSLQENAKIHVMVEDVIEACHNNIVAWENTSDVKPILIRGIDDYKKTKERYEILKKYFLQNNISYYELYSVKGDILSKIVNLVYLLDYVSIYCAILRQTDPTIVSSIDFVKSQLNL
ncbi:SIS domain-containing protein [Nitrosopumilus sp. K4]|nr:SIS domain-containing protein [Nitrosopumilus sp. K4]